VIITDIAARKIEQQFITPFEIALGTIRSVDTVIVKVETDAGITGFGEGSGLPFVSGESADIILTAVNILAPELTGKDPLDIAGVHEVMDRTMVRNGAAKAAVDLALFDIRGKHEGLPLFKLLGGVSKRVETDITLGVNDPVKMAAEAGEYAAQGFRQIKIKAGVSYENDIRAIRLIREAVGPHIKLKIDANQGWTSEQTLRVIYAIEDCSVDAIEQPTPWWDIAGLASVRSRSSIPVMADESCFDEHDAGRIVNEKAADMINIKLMKCGGLFKAIRINEIAKLNGLKCMLGCMAETRLGIAAAAALAAAKDTIVYADLDGFLCFHENKKISGGFTFETPYICLSDKPGHGVDIDF
jgi:L-alanine-DL-glutamate epimerase-like enolase superfamily enzyme